MLSKPTTARSRGRDSPAAFKVRMSPMAFRSVATTTALAGNPAANMAWAALCPPCSTLSRVSKKRLGERARPRWPASCSGKTRNARECRTAPGTHKADAAMAVARRCSTANATPPRLSALTDARETRPPRGRWTPRACPSCPELLHIPMETGWRSLRSRRPGPNRPGRPAPRRAVMEMVARPCRLHGGDAGAGQGRRPQDGRNNRPRSTALKGTGLGPL